MKTSVGETFAVVGGGITGLTAAQTFEDAGHSVVLFEAADRIGGKLATGRLEGMTVELGADSFLARERCAVELCERLGIAQELTAPATYGALIWTTAGLKPLPTGFLRGFPTSVTAALRSGVLSLPGALRTIGDRILPGPLKGGDISLGEFATRRFGRQLLERLIDPVLAGTRAGVPEEISLAAAAPEIDKIARSHRSVMAGLAQVRADGNLETGAPPFMTLGSGMQRLTERLRESLTATDIRLNTPVTGIKASADGCSVVTADEVVPVSGLVLAVPSFVAADLLAEVEAKASSALGELDYASVAIVTFVFPPTAVTPPSGSGILVPRSRGRTISACTWFSQKWPQHASEDGRTSIRCFVGRAGRPEILDSDDDRLAAAALADLRDAIGITAAPDAALVTRWDRSLPQYTVGHLDVVGNAEAALKSYPIELAGAGYRGSGIPDCIRQAQSAARSLIESRPSRR